MSDLSDRLRAWANEQARYARVSGDYLVVAVLRGTDDHRNVCLAAHHANKSLDLREAADIIDAKDGSSIGLIPEEDCSVCGGAGFTWTTDRYGGVEQLMCRCAKREPR